MERYDLYVDEKQLGAELDRPAAIAAAERTRRQLAQAAALRPYASPEVCVRIAQTGEVRAVWFWTPEGWRAHAAEGWA